MSYNVHNFVNGQIIQAEPINEMDLQIQVNESDIGDIAEQLESKADLVNGKVPQSQLPETDSSILEYESISNFPASGEAGKIYVALDTNKFYKWENSEYTEIGDAGAVIDDTAGEGDTDKTWSADKITEELENVDASVVRTVGPAEYVTFTDGADDQPLEQLTVSIAPVQDLHGYDKPWVGGAGKNLLEVGNVTPPTGITCTNNNGEVIINGRNESSSATWVYGEVYLEPGDYIFSGAYGNPDFYTDAITSSNRMYIVVDGVNVFDLEEGGKQFTVTTAGIYKPRIVFVGATSAGNRTFTNSKIYPMIRRAGTTSDWEPYKNICPITGWDGVEVSRTGKNLLDQETVMSGITSSGKYTPIYVGDGTFTMSTTTPLNTNNQSNLWFLPGNVSTGASMNDNGVWAGQSRIVTSQNGYVTVAYRNTYNVNPLDYVSQIERGSEVTDYVPYKTVYPIQFPSQAGTVYGGYLTIHKDGTGEVVADRSIHEYDGTESILLNATAGKFKQVNSYDWMRSSFGGELMSNMLTVGNSGDYVVAISDNIYFTFPMCETVADMKAKLAELYANGTPLVLSAKLNTPISYSLTANQVRTLLGYNAIWANTGMVEVEYINNSKIAEAYIELNNRIDSEADAINDRIDQEVDDLTDLIGEVNTALDTKASKVSGATNGNFAGLDSNGNLTDSGKKPSDFLTQHQDISGKVDKNQGTENAGKALGINNQGQVVPVPFSGDDFTGATGSTAGTHGYVPAPAAGDQNKVLKGDGTWETIPTMTGATALTDGAAGLAPAPLAGETGRFLRVDGTWVVPAGSGGSQVGIYAIDATIPTSSWVAGTNDYSVTISDQTVTSTMTVLEWGITNESETTPIMLGETDVTVGAGNVTITTTVIPTASWTVHIDLGTDGSDVLEEVAGKAGQELLGYKEDGNTASQAIADGSFVVWKGDLYKANGPIPQGTTFSSSNLTAVSSGGLNNLQSSVDSLNDSMVKLQIATTSVSLGAGQHTNARISYTVPGTIQTVLLASTANGSYMMGAVDSWTATDCYVGLYNTHPSVTIEGTVTVIILYK